MRTPAVRTALQNLARSGALVLRTEHGDVAMSSTATIWGEGPNVEGFRWSSKGRPAESIISDLRRAGMTQAEARQFVDAAEAWAEPRH